MPALKTKTNQQLPGSLYDGPVAIYVHWPFCLKKCPYCDFNSHVREEVSHKRWENALVREIETFAAYYPNLKVGSVFFGGGTPSLMAPETVQGVLEALVKHWEMPQNTEITLEANPSSVEAGRFMGYKAAGVNRLSVGIQSLKDETLSFLGRLHSAKEALAALETAQAIFERVSFDLIYANPGQTTFEWKQELQDALALGTSHLSLYQLTIEEGTAFYHQFHRGKFSLPDEETSAELFDLTQELTENAGLPAYEVSNHAAPGMESQHNLTYWRGLPYVGIGPGAHGRLPGANGTATAHAQIKRPEDWLIKVEQIGLGLDSAEHISAFDRAEEAIMTGLRLTKGVDLLVWEKLFGQKLEDILDMTALRHLQESEHIDSQANHLALTAKSRPLLNHIIGKLIA